MTDERAEQVQSIAAKLQKSALKNRSMTAHRFFFGYACAQFTHTPLYTHWQGLLAYIRKIRAIAITLRILTVILTVLETGALVILTTALFLVILPILGALMLGILITALLESRRTNRLLAGVTRGRSVYVLFMDASSSPFFSAHAQSLAANGGAVLIVSPYWISSKGISHGRFYCTARKEGDGIYLIRRYYFFSLKKNVLSLRTVGYVY